MELLRCKAHGAFGRWSDRAEMDRRLMARNVGSRETIVSPPTRDVETDPVELTEEMSIDGEDVEDPTRY